MLLIHYSFFIFYLNTDTPSVILSTFLIANEVVIILLNLSQYRLYSSYKVIKSSWINIQACLYFSCDFEFTIMCNGSSSIKIV